MILTLGLMLIFIGNVESVDAGEPFINANASITVDYDTGQVLQAHNENEELGIASVTKIIVEYILFEEIENGNLQWDEVVEISDYAYSIGTDYRLSNIPLNQTYKYTVKDLYEALSLRSANAATIALAEKIEGSEPAFVDRMKETVERFNVHDAKIFNTTGLPNEYMGTNIYPGSTPEDENSMSARSVAKITSRIIKDYPEILKTSKLYSKVFAEGTDHSFLMTSTNQLLPGGTHERAGVDGLKTGTTGFAGRTFTGTAKEGERRLITVVLNCHNDRFVETNKQLDYGFNEFKSVNLNDDYEEWKQITKYKPLKVLNGKLDDLDYHVESDLDLLVDDIDNFDLEVIFNKDIVDTDNGIKAPISKGDELGYVKIFNNGEELSYLNEDINKKFKVISSSSVNKQHILAIKWNELGLKLKQLFKTLL